MSISICRRSTSARIVIKRHGGYAANGKIYQICPAGSGTEKKLSSSGVVPVPNPFTNRIVVHSTEIIVMLRLLNIRGELLVKSKSSSLNGLSNLAAGNHILECIFANGNRTIHQLVKYGKPGLN